ncbi:MAG: GntR family transcriptional regulator [Actinobacteria bacterium]|uniref:Unannotated protein n=1 Tax=freshwater metagenome TaxID=449393 RepID=A0A6J7S6C4_9ZZZZ|nr:GntR family transcriptional regulator [Actinomycetota bacterium]MTB27491.1 GntR family transcriptional regulator [Actinomycetota bacterium]
MTTPMPPLSAEPVHVPKTAEVVAQAIRNQIVRGDIAEGAALPSEAELMVHFGVSRPSLREAFRILESEKLITVRRGSRGGARATRPDVSVAARYLGLLMQFDGVLLSDVFEARAMIEPLALRLLARRDNRQEAAAELLAIMDEIVPGIDPRLRVDVWSRFYAHLFHSCGNKTLELLYGTLTGVVRSELSDSIFQEDEGSQSPNWKKTIIKAMTLVSEGKGDEAANYWMKQMLLIEARVQEAHQRRTLIDATVAFA